MIHNDTHWLSLSKNTQLEYYALKIMYNQEESIDSRKYLFIIFSSII